MVPFKQRLLEEAAERAKPVDPPPPSHYDPDGDGFEGVEARGSRELARMQPADDDDEMDSDLPGKGRWDELPVDDAAEEVEADDGESVVADDAADRPIL